MSESPTTEGMVRLTDVLDLIDACDPPDSYFYAKQSERVAGWSAARNRIRGKLEELANVTDKA